MNASPRIATPRVLVADDDADMRLYLRGCLKAYGLACIHEAAGGREALQLARASPPDLVVCDMLMAGLDGLALCRALKADDALALVPVLIISGQPAEELDCADGFLAKPFNAAQLHTAIRRLLPQLP